MVDYRERIYPRYATAMQDPSLDGFDRTRARAWGRPYRHYLRRWLPEDRSASILEVACGGGRLLQALLDHGYQNLSGVDLSPEQVGLSRQVLVEGHVHEGDATSFMRNGSERFDLIIGLDIVEHLTKDEVLPFLDAAWGALNPGGRLILQTPNAASPWGAEYRYGDFTHEVGFTPNALHRLLALAGFEGLEAREMGPVPHGALSCIRWALWHLLRLGLFAWNLVEMGHRGSGVVTRIMLVSARKPLGR